MRIQYASDLHLEMHANARYLKEQPLEVSGEILLLAGDIGYLGDDNYQRHPFWDWAAEHYQQDTAAWVIMSSTSITMWPLYPMATSYRYAPMLSATTTISYT